MNPTNNPRGLNLPWQMNPEYATHPGSLIGQMYILQLRNGGRMGGWHTAPPKDEAELQHRMEVLRENHGNDFRRIVELAKEVHDGTTGGNNGSDEWKDVPLQRHPRWYEESLRETGQNPPEPKSWRKKGRDKVSAGAHMRGGGLSHSKSREMPMYVPMSGAPSARPPSGSYGGPFEPVRSTRSHDRESRALGTLALSPRNQSRQSRVRSTPPRNQSREHRVQSTSPVHSASAARAPSSRSHERGRRRSTPPAPPAIPVQREPSAREKRRSPTPPPAPARPQVNKAPRTVAPKRDPRQKVAKKEEMRYKERDGQTARGGDHIRGYEPKKDRDEGFPKTIVRS